MRKYIRRGMVSTKIEYERLRKDVWDEFYKFYTDGNALHDSDIQFIAMVKAKERGLLNFKVNIYELLFENFSSISLKKIYCI